MPGGQDALQAAFAARGMNGQPVGQLNQVTPQAPSGPSPVPGQAPEMSGMGSPQTQSSPPSMGNPTPSEAEIIIKALDSRLKMLGKIEGARAGV